MSELVIEWSQKKNEELKIERGLSFEEAEVRILNGDILADTPHPNQDKYPGQAMLYILICLLYTSPSPRDA